MSSGQRGQSRVAAYSMFEGAPNAQGPGCGLLYENSPSLQITEHDRRCPTGNTDPVG